MESLGRPAQRQSLRLAEGADRALGETSLKTRTGSLGAVWDGQGVDFSVLSEHATGVDLCLFAEATDMEEIGSHPLERDAEGIWRLYLPDIGPGQLYGYRVPGPWRPEEGHRFDPSKLLVDPGARAVCGDTIDDPSLVGHEQDSTPFVPKSVVVDPEFDWQGDRPPATPWRDTVIYECHVRGMTRLHPDLPEELRGTYLGLIQEPILDHLSSLGVTAVELLPVQQFVSEHHLVESGLRNYFGYNPLAFFAPHAAYASGDKGQQVNEFKAMVRGLHLAGLEVLLDVVFNHTAEGDHRGPTLCLRGLDNHLYYRLRDDDPRFYENFSGCGNTVDTGDPRVARWLIGCLRYWVEEMHIDGFRFDLATTLGRHQLDFDAHAPLFQKIASDPVLAAVKLIAEPWDLGPGGYQLGRFPTGWAEWNDRFRDDVRSFWRGDHRRSDAFAGRFEASPDVFAREDRRPEEASINFVTCHDGFTLHDLVSYEQKHNLANGEENRDGHNHNLSRNWGAEGPTDSPAILAQRERVKRSLLTTLALSRGVPMLSHGDELSRTQMGNNNAYCQDNEITWIDWSRDEAGIKLLDFARRAFELRRRLMAASPGPMQGKRWNWITANGRQMTGADWSREEPTPLGLLLGDAPELFFLLFNPEDEVRLFTLPRVGDAGSWHQILSTADDAERRLRGRSVRLARSSLLLLEWMAADRTTSSA